MPWPKAVFWRLLALPPELRAVHVTPSGDVRMAPPVPTATNWLLMKLTPRRLAEGKTVPGVQVVPLVEVNVTPLRPTPMSRPAPAAMPPKPEVAVMVEVQLTPSDELKTRPLTAETA